MTPAKRAIMKKIFKIFLFISIAAFIASCSKKDVEQTENTSPVISNLVYNPHVVTINMSTPGFFVSGTIDYRNARNGISKLRLTNSAGADITMDLSSIESEPSSGQITAAFEFMMPPDPVTHTFEIWIVDGKGNSSNKLSGSVQFIR
jgi:hypothetical protein